MGRKKKTKAQIITGVLYGIFAVLVLAALYGLFSLGCVLFGAAIGNGYYADLAEDYAAAETVDFPALIAINPEVRAWVRLDDTAVDLPIVQTSDNSFYLTHRFDEQANKLGTPFIDSGCPGDFSGRHTVIYGHAVRSGAMFGSFWEYENPNYYLRHPTLTLTLTDGTEYTLEVFACSRVESVRSAIPIVFASENAFLAYIDELHELSAITTDVEIVPTDRIVSFCVVLPDGGDGLLLVSCRIAGDTVADLQAENTGGEETQQQTTEPETSPGA